MNPEEFQHCLDAQDEPRWPMLVRSALLAGASVIAWLAIGGGVWAFMKGVVL